MVNNNNVLTMVECIIIDKTINARRQNTPLKEVVDNLVDKAINTKMAIKVTVAMSVNKKTHYHIRTYNSKAYSDYL